jgi:hypothetical protein
MRPVRSPAYNGGVEGRGDRFEGLNLTPPERGFGLWCKRNADLMGTRDGRGCTGLSKLSYAALLQRRFAV